MPGKHSLSLGSSITLLAYILKTTRNGSVKQKFSLCPFGTTLMLFLMVSLCLLSRLFIKQRNMALF